MGNIDDKLDSSTNDSEKMWLNRGMACIFGGLGEYYKPRRLERWKNGRVYEWIGVNYVRKALLKLENVTSKSEDPYYRLSGNSPLALRYMDIKTRTWESIHQVLNIVTAGSGAGLFLTDKLDLPEAIVGGLGLAVNSSLIIVHRYTRARIQNILDRYNLT